MAKSKRARREGSKSANVVITEEQIARSLEVQEIHPAEAAKRDVGAALQKVRADLDIALNILACN